MTARPGALDVLPAGYAELFDTVVAACAADDRVRGLWVSGSLAKGTGDAASDLDLVVTVADADFDGFAAGWREWLAAITPTVLANPLPFAPGSFYSMTPACERLDVVVERAGAIAATMHRHRIAVIDIDGLAARLPPPEAAPGPSAARVTAIVEEFLRICALAPVIVERRDWLLGLEGVHTQRGGLYQLFCEANAPLPPSGLKHWSAKLRPTQRDILERLPTGGPSREEVLDGHAAVFAAFLPAARAVTADLGAPWPAAFENAVRDHWRRRLGLELPA